MSIADVPALPSEFHHATLSEVLIGPRRELTLTLLPLLWTGSTGHDGPAVRVRFGGIVNLPEVAALFAKNYHQSSELTWLSYDRNHKSKPGDLYLRLEFERVEAGVTVHCSKITITEAEQPAASHRLQPTPRAVS